MPAQFIAIPALTKIQDFFVKATGVSSFYVGVEWFSWAPLISSDIEVFRCYIRPSHYALIDAAVADPNNGTRVCSFLRQLLRPHKFKIQARVISRSIHTWVLVSTDTDAAVGKHEGAIVSW
jgi:hypothetical protein